MEKGWRGEGVRKMEKGWRGEGGEDGATVER